jgi:hypothetical protein
METVWLVQVSNECDRKVEAVCATEVAALRVVAELHEVEDHTPDLALCRRICAMSWASSLWRHGRADRGDSLSAIALEHISVLPVSRSPAHCAPRPARPG